MNFSTSFNKLVLSFIILISGPGFAYAQGPIKKITVLNYNVENLFNTIDDARKRDEDYTPEGRNKWTKSRLTDKLNQLARIIKNSTPDGRGPDVLLLTEVENRSVLNLLIKRLPKKYPYRIHVESEDLRGIDNSIISRYPAKLINTYRVPNIPQYDSSLPQVSIPGVNDKIRYLPTRRILEVDINVRGRILKIILNHWTSRMAGVEKSEHKRVSAAQVVRKVIDSTLKINKRADILVAGDFNDNPENTSIRKVIKAVGDRDAVKQQLYRNSRKMKFYNLADQIVNLERLYKLRKRYPDLDDFQELAYEQLLKRGTYFYHRNSEWDSFDQILVSPGLLDSKGFKVVRRSFKIVSPNYSKDEGGAPIPYRINRSTGKYIRGYSDHFGVITTLAVY